MTYNRRQWLGAALALGLSPVLAPLAQAVSAVSNTAADRLILRQRWASGNQQLVPTSDLDGHILFAGERQLGLIDLAQPQAVWSVAHRLPSGASFRPRGNQHGVVCGGLAEIAGWRVGDGNARWRYRARDQIGTPCLAGNTVYFGDGHRLLAVNCENGEILWHFDAVADTRISYAPVAVGDSVLVGPGDGRLIALSTSDGKPRWIADRMADWQYLRQLHISGNTLVAGSYKEKLHGIEIASGRQIWEFSAGNFINSHHVANGVAYLWSPTGWLYAIDAESGRQRWRHRTNDYRGGIHNWGAMLAELSSDDTRLYALDLNNVLHILAVDDGRALLDVKLPERFRPFVQPVREQGLILGNNSGQILLFSPPA